MKINFRLVIAVTSVLLMTSLWLRSQNLDSGGSSSIPLPEPALFSDLPSTDVHWEITQLLRKKAGEFKLFDVSTQEDPTASNEKRPDLLILERFIVTHRPAEKVELPPPETLVQKFFNTGNFATHVGKKITTRFWMHPRKGLMLSFEF